MLELMSCRLLYGNGSRRTYFSECHGQLASLAASHRPGAAKTGAVSTPGYLRKAAEVLAKESCGEPWLLQPKIRDMESLEYR